jgi:hypothetical protein
MKRGANPRFIIGANKSLITGFLWKPVIRLFYAPYFVWFVRVPKVRSSR